MITRIWNCLGTCRWHAKNNEWLRRRGSPRHFLLTSALLIAHSASAAVLPADRVYNWQGNVGVPGGIPTRTTIFRNMVTAGAKNNGTVDCSTILQNAINSCPANQVIYFPAGTYRIDRLVYNSNRSNITIRGAGMGKTRLMLYAGGGNGAFNIGSSDWPKPVAALRITGGAVAGSNTVNLLNTATVAVGHFIRIEQANPTWVKPLNGDVNNMAFLFKVTGKTANSVTFSPSLPFTLTNTPKVAVYSKTPIQGVGIENLTFDLTNSGASSSVFLEQAYGCWFKGVEVYHAYSRQIWFNWVLNSEIRECYTHHARSRGPNTEGIDLYENSCWNLIENNICIRGGFPMIILGDWKGGCAGNVIGYNYCYNVDTGSDIAGADISVNHGPHNMMNLFEGNVAGGFISDGYYGSASHNTVFRNWFSVTHPTFNRNLKAIGLNRWSTYFNIAGNVLGSAHFPGNPGGLYETEIADVNSITRLIYQLGYPNMGNNWHSGIFGATEPPDYTTQGDLSQLDGNVNNTLIRHGNYDYSTHSIKWDQSIADHALPASYYRTSKPSWFGNATWPPIDPARPATATNAAIPAGDRYLNSTLPVLNISTRGFIQDGDKVLIGGFVVSGTGQKKMLLRALGPSLPLTPVVADPVIELRDVRGAVIATNDNWRTSQAAAITATGLAPSKDKESALLVTLNPGSYTAVVRGVNHTTGIGLVEAYDLDSTGSAKLSNISTRGNVLSGNGVLIGGFVLGSGSWTAPIVVRAIGPSLSRFGVTAPLADPVVELHDRYGALIARNDNWRDTDAIETQLAGLPPSDAREATIVMRLAPGNYTAIVSGKNGASGVGLVEVYNLR